MTDGKTSEQQIIDEVLGAESERCRAIGAADWPGLDALLADQVIYTHLDGKRQDRRAYFEDAKTKQRTIHRQHLEVINLGDVAVMQGAMSFDEQPTPDRVALQVWSKQRGNWSMVACQSTPLASKWLDLYR